MLEFHGARALDWRRRSPWCNVVAAVHGDKWSSSAVSQAALNGLEQAADLNVAGGKLNADELVVLLDSGVGVSVGLVVDVAGHFLGEAVSKITELVVVAVDFVGVVAVDTLACVHFKVVGSPGLGSVDWTREAVHWITREANHSVLLRGRGLGVDDSRHVGA